MKHVIQSRAQYLCALAAGKSVLDIGCVGRPDQAFTDPYWLHGQLRASARNLVGLDNNEAGVRQLRQHGFEIECADCTMFDIGRQFDLVVAGELIEHLSDHRGFFASVRKHLRPDGVLALTTPNALCLTYAIQNLLYGREEELAEHTCLFSPTTLRVMLDQNGFELVRILYYTKYEFQKLRGARLVFQWIQRALAVFRPSFCHYLIAECRLKPNVP
jgi:2-polyprenyl-3-methyl-5-hydroxy-6-metoxy-1,4-benzoquinol methylase